MKTVRLDDEPYEVLCRARLTSKESFGKVIKRLAGSRPKWEDSAGAWSDKTDLEIKQLRRESVEPFGEP